MNVILTVKFFINMVLFMRKKQKGKTDHGLAGFML
jgi:uncharacterized membrane protein